MRIKEYISATTLSKKTSATLDAFARGETEKMIILKNNEPRAVLLSMEAYEAMEEEIGFSGNIPLHVLIAKDNESDDCYVVTTYVPRRDIWNKDFKTRRIQS
jgi:hypothetical protein